MKSVSIKIKLATVLAVSVIVGIVLYAKADQNNANDSSADNAYTIRSSSATNLNASMKAHSRASEYTSTEYSSKMAPAITNATNYIALYEDNRLDDDSYQYQRKSVPQGQGATGSYQRKTAPVDQSEIKVEGQRPPQSTSSAYQSFGVRATSTKNMNTEVVESKTTVVDIDSDNGGYQRRSVDTTPTSNYAKAVDNASINDDAYQIKRAPQGTSNADDSYAGYAVRSAGGKDIQTAQQQSQQSSETYGGYNVRSVGDGTSARSTASAEGEYAVRRAPQGQGTNSASDSYGGYAVRSAGGKDIQTAQQQSHQSSETYGGYNVRSVGDGTSAGSTASAEGGYTVRRAPQGTNQAPSSLAQYDNAKNSDDAYQVKTTQSSGDTYGGYAVRSAGGKDISTTRVAVTNDTYGGYNVKSAGSKSTSSNLASEGGYARKRVAQGNTNQDSDYAQRPTPPQSREDTYGGYAVKSAGGKDVSTAQTVTPDDSYGGYAIKSAGSKDIAQYDNANQSDGAYQVNARPDSEESYGGYAVRSAGGRSSNLASNTTTPKTVRKGTGVPKSTGIKIYDNRGHRVSVNTSQNNRSVLIMPKRGRSTTGIVIQDDPGRSIVVQSTAGTQSTYKYGEIDALVNL